MQRCTLCRKCGRPWSSKRRRIAVRHCSIVAPGPSGWQHPTHMSVELIGGSKGKGVSKIIEIPYFNPSKLLKLKWLPHTVREHAQEFFLT